MESQLKKSKMGLESSLLNMTKNEEVLGTWQKSVFQLGLQAVLDVSSPEHSNERITLKKQDPLHVEIFDVLGFHCIPHLGVYGDNYLPCSPMILIQLPAIQQILHQQLPKEMIDIIMQHINSEEKIISNIEMYISCCSRPIPSECQKFMCSNFNEVNMMYHAWTAPSIRFSKDLLVSEQVEMGLFNCDGIKPVHQNLKDAGISFGTISERSVVIHNSCFSPENAQFQLEEVKSCSFFSLAKHKQRMVSVLHIFPTTLAMEDDFQNTIYKCSTLQQLISGIQILDSLAAKKLSQVLLPLQDFVEWKIE